MYKDPQSYASRSCNVLRRITHEGLAMTEEALRMVVFEWLQTVWTPEIQKERNQREIESFYYD